MKKNIIRIGNSWGVTLDRLILLATGIEPTDKLKVECEKGKIILTKVKGE